MARCRSAEVDLDKDVLGTLGFEVSKGLVRIPADAERLNPSSIREAMSTRAREWVKELAAHEIVGSTSTMFERVGGVGIVDSRRGADGRAADPGPWQAR